MSASWAGAGATVQATARIAASAACRLATRPVRARWASIHPGPRPLPLFGTVRFTRSGFFGPSSGPGPFVFPGPPPVTPRAAGPVQEGPGREGPGREGPGREGAPGAGPRRGEDPARQKSGQR